MTVQGQRVFKQQPSFRGSHARCTLWGKGIGRGRKGRSIAPFDRSRNSSTTQFALSRMTSPGFLVAILGARYLSLAIWLIPDDPPRLSTLKPLLDILPTCPPSPASRKTPRSREWGTRNFSKILDVRKAWGFSILSVRLGLSRFNFSLSHPLYSILIHSQTQLFTIRWKSFPKSDIENERKGEKKKKKSDRREKKRERLGSRKPGWMGK